MPSDLFAPLPTARLHMRAPALQDAAALSALKTPFVSKGLASWPSPFTPQMARQRIESVRSAAARGDALPCVITLRDGKALAGWVALHRIPESPGRAALSYWLGMAYHGHGYAGEAARALIQAGFTRLGLEVIEAGAQLENAASFAVMRACGMAAAGERMVYASSRDRDERCGFYEISRPPGPI